MSSDLSTPSLEEFRATLERIAPHVNRTPIQNWRSPALTNRLGGDTEVLAKLEVFQPTGTFKARGAINNALAMTEQERARGITTISAGNHAVAASYAAQCVGASAKVVMMAAANKARIAAARTYGAEVFLADTIEGGFQQVEDFKQQEGRTYIPSFPNRGVICGTGTIALEVMEQVDAPDVILVPVGGGGLISGIAACAKQLAPACRIIGVEAVGAGVMSKSLAAGGPVQLEDANTIADSIAPPVTNEYAHAMVFQYVDEIVHVTDDQMAAAAALMFADLKLAVEPAGAATTAALLGPARDQVVGRRVVPIICGTNIDPAGYMQFLERGVTALENGVL